MLCQVPEHFFLQLRHQCVTPNHIPLPLFTAWAKNKSYPSIGSVLTQQNFIQISHLNITSTQTTSKQGMFTFVKNKCSDCNAYHFHVLQEFRSVSHFKKGIKSSQKVNCNPLLHYINANLCKQLEIIVCKHAHGYIVHMYLSPCIYLLKTLFDILFRSSPS